jgi:hypothetical protein
VSASVSAGSTVKQAEELYSYREVTYILKPQPDGRTLIEASYDFWAFKGEFLTLSVDFAMPVEISKVLAGAESLKFEISTDKSTKVTVFPRVPVAGPGRLRFTIFGTSTGQISNEGLFTYRFSFATTLIPVYVDIFYITVHVPSGDVPVYFESQPSLTHITGVDPGVGSWFITWKAFGVENFKASVNVIYQPAWVVAPWYVKLAGGGAIVGLVAVTLYLLKRWRRMLEREEEEE